MSVVLLPPGFAAFQNCFCAEYLFIGHSLKRQSRGGNKKRKVKSYTSSFHISSGLLDLSKQRNVSVEQSKVLAHCGTENDDLCAI